MESLVRLLAEHAATVAVGFGVVFVFGTLLYILRQKRRERRRRRF